MNTWVIVAIAAASVATVATVTFVVLAEDITSWPSDPYEWDYFSEVPAPDYSRWDSDACITLVDEYYESAVSSAETAAEKDETIEASL